MIRLTVALFLAICVMLHPKSADAANAERMVELFHGAMGTVPELKNLERFAASEGFMVVSRERAGGYVSFLETVDASGNTFLVGIREHNETLGANVSRVLVTQYGTTQTFFKTLVKSARRSIPKGPAQKVDLDGGFVAGQAWEANYPGLVTFQIKYHQPERASLMEALVVSGR